MLPRPFPEQLRKAQDRANEMMNAYLRCPKDKHWILDMHYGLDSQVPVIDGKMTVEWPKDIELPTDAISTKQTPERCIHELVNNK